MEFGQAAYTAAEGGTVKVKVTLSDDPEMDLTIPISKTNEGGATSADYSGVPPSVTFGSGDTSKTFVFTAETDTVDDDGESVKLSFGTLPTTPVTVTAGTTDEATVTINDDDAPSVSVSFGSAAYTVAESDDPDTTDVTENTVEVTVTLSADPERTVVIPHGEDQPGRRHHRRLLGRAAERNLRQRGHLQDLRHHRRPRHRRRRRRERQAELRVEPACRGERRDT